MGTHSMWAVLPRVGTSKQGGKSPPACICTAQHQYCHPRPTWTVELQCLLNQDGSICTLQSWHRFVTAVSSKATVNGQKDDRYDVVREAAKLASWSSLDHASSASLPAKLHATLGQDHREGLKLLFKRRASCETWTSSQRRICFSAIA